MRGLKREIQQDTTFDDVVVFIRKSRQYKLYVIGYSTFHQHTDIQGSYNAGYYD